MILKEPLLPQGPAMDIYPVVKLRPRGRGLRFTFLAKLAAALALVALADFLFYSKVPGSTLGLFALAWTVALVLAVPASRKSRRARPALIAAILMSLVLAYDPSPMAALLFLLALFAAGVLPFRRLDDAARFAIRFAAHAAMGLITPIRDARRLLQIPRPHLRSSALAIVATLALPLIGALVFIALFANANPIVENLLPNLAWPDIDLPRIIFWGVVFAIVWQSFKPLRLALALKLTTAERRVPLPGVNPLSVTLSLILFNALFAVENGLDVIFLWSGAPLPHGVTLADYAHRGAYPLIVTALLAAAFVLLTARPDSEAARRPLIRRLVVAWIAQNIFLVLSSALRTLDYINAYELTVMRIAALAWMGLVALGLVLICWRMLKGHSIRWLINANALAALSVLALCTMADLPGIAAQWNVRHAREVGGSGEALDLDYLHRLGAPALVPLAELEQRKLPCIFHDRVAWVRDQIIVKTKSQQSKPYGWTAHNVLALARAQAILGARPYVPTPNLQRTGDGYLDLPTEKIACP